MLIPEGPAVWNTMKGLICVYKPAEMSFKKLRRILISKICQETLTIIHKKDSLELVFNNVDINQLPGRSPTAHIQIEGNPSESLTVSVKPSFADHPLVVGPRYQECDLVVSWSNYLGFHTSGVLLFGLRSGTKQAKFIRENKPTRTYRVKGVLGQVTDNCFATGKIVQKSTWKHVRQSNMDQFLSTMQAAHQRKMFELCGVDMQSQTAYDLASRGLIRPADSKIPVIYGIKCVEFNGPEFTLEIQCINEYEDYLMHLIHEIGQKLHSTAHCTSIQCIRHSRFTLNDTLLMKHWTLVHILENIENCAEILKKDSECLFQRSAILI